MMRLSFVRKGLLEYITKTIKPMYRNFDKAHNTAHFQYVTSNCVEYGRELLSRGEDVDLEIAYVVGALHDIGLLEGREGHSKYSGRFVREDAVLPEYFTGEQIELIAQAVEDHSSHLQYTPRSVYGKIVADADRNNTVYLVFSRPIKYGIKNESYRTKIEHIDRVYEFVNANFGRSGYVKYWLDIPKVTREQDRVWALLDNEQECKKYIEGLFDEITRGKYKPSK